MFSVELPLSGLVWGESTTHSQVRKNFVVSFEANPSLEHSLKLIKHDVRAAIQHSVKEKLLLVETLVT